MSRPSGDSPNEEPAQKRRRTEFAGFGILRLVPRRSDSQYGVPNPPNSHYGVPKPPSPPYGDPRFVPTPGIFIPGTIPPRIENTTAAASRTDSRPGLEARDRNEEGRQIGNGSSGQDHTPRPEAEDELRKQIRVATLAALREFEAQHGLVGRWIGRDGAFASAQAAGANSPAGPVADHRLPAAVDDDVIVIKDEESDEECDGESDEGLDESEDDGTDLSSELGGPSRPLGIDSSPELSPRFLRARSEDFTLEEEGPYYKNQRDTHPGLPDRQKIKCECVPDASATCCLINCLCKKWGAGCTEDCGCVSAGDGSKCESSFTNKKGHLTRYWYTEKLFGADAAGCVVDPRDGQPKPIYPTLCFKVFLLRRLRDVKNLDNPKVMSIARMALEEEALEDLLVWLMARPDGTDDSNDSWLGWMRRWNTAGRLKGRQSSKERLKLAQELLRLVASEGPGAPRKPRRFFSFCRKDWVSDKHRGMHCLTDQSCAGCRQWHCTSCQTCMCEHDKVCISCRRKRQPPDHGGHVEPLFG